MTAGIVTSCFHYRTDMHVLGQVTYLLERSPLSSRTFNMFLVFVTSLCTFIKRVVFWTDYYRVPLKGVRAVMLAVQAAQHGMAGEKLSPEECEDVSPTAGSPTLSLITSTLPYQ